MKLDIMKSLKKALAIAVMGSAVMAQMSCEKNSDVIAGQIEYGRWVVDYYNSLDAGLVSPNAAALTMCNYQGDGVNNSVLLDITGNAFAYFYKNGSSNWLMKADGRTVSFSKPTAGWEAEGSYYAGKETKGDTILKRRYEFTTSPSDFRVFISAGNEAAINIIPKTDFVVATYDDVSGVTKLTMTQKREKRYIRIRTDYKGYEKQPDDTYQYVIYTDLYQVDCGSAAGRVAEGSTATVAPKMERIARLKNLVDAKTGNARVGVGQSIPTSREFVRN